MHIDREDMLELTRRMTVSRNCFSRIAGAYMDEEGFITGWIREPGNRAALCSYWRHYGSAN